MHKEGKSFQLHPVKNSDQKPEVNDYIPYRFQIKKSHEALWANLLKKTARYPPAAAFSVTSSIFLIKTVSFKFYLQKGNN